jgi:peptidoglycan/LPS O-acetylase OafA/YrhL
MSHSTSGQNLGQHQGISRDGAPPLAVPRSQRYLSLDLWRGVACLMVVVHHSAFFLPHAGSPNRVRATFVSDLGLFAVIGFFVISGYCIAATCDTQRRKPHGLGNYFRRRFRRIFPPYWAALLATIVFVAAVRHLAGPQLLTDDPNILPTPRILPNPTSINAAQWFGNITLIETWRSNVFGGTRLMQLGPAWTLCYEEQFYALCGILLLLSRRHFFWGIVGISVMTFGLMAVHRSIPGLFFDGNWFIFAAGVLVYFSVNYATRLQQWLLAAVLAVSALACARHHPLSDWRTPMFVFGPVIALVFLALHPFDRRMALAPILRPLKFSGTICYSLYLVHWPIVMLMSNALYRIGVRSDLGLLLVTIPLCMAVSLLVAWGFHLAVERRFLNSVSSVNVRDKAKEISPSAFVAGTA